MPIPLRADFDAQMVRAAAKRSEPPSGHAGTLQEALAYSASVFETWQQFRDRLTLGMRAPRQAGDLVDGGGISGGCCGGLELIGEHGQAGDLNLRAG